MKMLRSIAALPLLLALVAAPALAGVQDEAAAALSSIESKLIDLAKATPEEKYSWRPMEGVRSTSEVFMHVAGASYFFGGRFLGAAPPQGVNPGDLEKTVKTRDEVVANLEKAFEYARNAITGVSDAELEEEVDMFGRKTTKRAAIMTMVEHAAEHLGQSIAYARMNEITPPWSQ